MTPHDGKNERLHGRTSERVRDFFVLGGGSAGVFALLIATGALGIVEGFTAIIVVLAGTLAYFVGSLPASSQPQQSLQETSHTNQITHGTTVAAILSAIPFPAIYLSADGRVVHANQEVTGLLRTSSAKGQLKSLVIRQPDVLAASDRVAKTGAGERVEFASNDGQEVWLAHIEAGAEPGSVIIVIEDRTAVHRAERARADFLANASHELRTPLTALSGFIETMRGPAHDDRDSWDGFLAIMHQQTDRMRRLVSDLLSLSRIEFSEHRPPDTRTDLAQILELAMVSLQPIATEHEVSLELEGADAPLPIIAQPDEITQVVQNLVSNAVKYSPKGQKVRVICGKTSTMYDAATESGRRRANAGRAVLLQPRASAEVPAVWLRVEDYGQGVSRQHLPRLGERFYRADESRGGEIEGTGLGLAIVKHIMSRHRGGLSVESTEGEGAAFGIWLPLAPAGSAADAER